MITYFLVVSPPELAATVSDTRPEGKSEYGVRGETAADKREKEDEEREGVVSSSPDAVNVHIEAVVGALELLLYSDVGGVAEVKVKG